MEFDKNTSLNIYYYIIILVIQTIIIEYLP